ncbi:hypothetical protein ABT173_04965 [Streptomyces sp. NPDC001795]|uniref:hypothetical protein n=1 Tax=Streptomyces sp. NPDC001795 TaxID=3154525 RepID=UPI00331E2667
MRPPHRTADLVQSANSANSANSADSVVGHVRGERTDLLGPRACGFEQGVLCRTGGPRQ